MLASGRTFRSSGHHGVSAEWVAATWDWVGGGASKVFKYPMTRPPSGVSPGEMEARVPKRAPRNGDSDIIAVGSKTVPTRAPATGRTGGQAGAAAPWPIGRQQRNERREKRTQDGSALRGPTASRTDSEAQNPEPWLLTRGANWPGGARGTFWGDEGPPCLDWSGVAWGARSPSPCAGTTEHGPRVSSLCGKKLQDHVTGMTEVTRNQSVPPASLSGWPSRGSGQQALRTTVHSVDGDRHWRSLGDGYPSVSAAFLQTLPRRSPTQ